MRLKDWTRNPSSSEDWSSSRTESSPREMRSVPAARACTGAEISLDSRKPNQMAPMIMSMAMSPMVMYRVIFHGDFRLLSSRYSSNPRTTRSSL